MYKNKALVDRTLNTPSDNDNSVMMYHKLVSLIEEYNRMARDKGLPTKKIPIYSNSINYSLMMQSVASILKDIDRVKSINEEQDDTKQEKIKRGVIFDETNEYNDDIWTYVKSRIDNNLKANLNIDEFSGKFGDVAAITLNYDDMPYEKLIDKEGNEYPVNGYNGLFLSIPMNVTSLAIDDWTNTNVTNMGAMFNNCSSLTSLTLGDRFNTSEVTNMIKMFDGCSKLTSLTLSDNFDTSKVTDMEEMFDGCSSLKSLTLGNNFDTSNVEHMVRMFYGYEALTTLKLYESAKSIIKWLPSDTWTVKDNSSTILGTVTISQVSATWDPAGLPNSWGNAQWTLTRTIQQTS